MNGKILFISPEFFGYENRLIDIFKSKQFEVTFFSDRPKLSTLGKGIMRLMPFLLKSKVRKYFHDEILQNCNINKYDYIFVVLGQSFNSNMILELKKNQSNAKFILYLWDSIDNFPQCLELSKAFDEVFTFDNSDAAKYNFKFLPLFFEKKMLDVNEYRDIDMSCVCTVKKGKYKDLKCIRDYFEPKLNCYFYFYLQSKLVYVYYKLFDKDFKGAKISEFQFKKLPYDKNLEIIKNSKVVLDVQMKNQNGLTMRTFETLALHSRLVTTNCSIKEYDFFDEGNIFIFDKNNFDKCLSFVCSDYRFNVNKDFEEKYSLDNWVKTIFGF